MNKTILYLAIGAGLLYLILRQQGLLAAAPAKAAPTGPTGATTSPSAANQQAFDAGIVPPGTNHPETVPVPGAGYPMPYTPPAPTPAPTPTGWLGVINTVGGAPAPSTPFVNPWKR